VKHSQEEICEIADELERVARARSTYRRRRLVLSRDYSVKTVSPGMSGILVAFPGDLPCCPDAIPECLTVDVDRSILVPDNADPAAGSTELLSLKIDWSAAELKLEADLVSGASGTFIGQRINVRYVYLRDPDSEIVQPDVEIRCAVVEGCPKSSPTNMWNLRKTIVVGTVPDASESTPQKIPDWSNEAHLQTPDPLTAGLTLILNQYAAPNGILLSSSTIGKGSGAGAPIVQGARFFTVVNLGVADILGVRVIFSLGQ